MAFNSIMNLFLPKDRIFYSLFEKSAANLNKIGYLLHSFVYESEADKRKNLFLEITSLEKQNDELTHEIFQELSRNFITPFDREDIHSLAKAMDEVADYIYASAKKMQVYNVNPSEHGIQKMAEVIKQGTEEIEKTVAQLRELKKPERILTALERIKSLENHADDLFDLSIKHLFETENDFKELIRHREIYIVMEMATDKFIDVSYVLEAIIVKYA